MIDRLLIGLLTGGHVLLEGVPGLAKTLAVRTLADALDVVFRRIQFTPDLLPADLIGTLIWDEGSGDFVPKRGPIQKESARAAIVSTAASPVATLGDTTPAAMGRWRLSGCSRSRSASSRSFTT